MMIKSIGGMIMKKKLMIMLSVSFLILIGVVLSIYNKPFMGDTLSEDEIAMLRVSYPINDETPPNYEMISRPLEQYIELCDSYLEVEVVKEPILYTKNYDLGTGTPEEIVDKKGGGLSEGTWIKCEVRIINDIWDSIQKDTIFITYNSAFEIGMPTMKVGSRFIIGGEYDVDKDMLNISSKTMFYVTESGHVLSVQSEESRSRYSGYKVDDFIKYIKKEK